MKSSKRNCSPHWVHLWFSHPLRREHRSAAQAESETLVRGTLDRVGVVCKSALGSDTQNFEWRVSGALR
jgi:hypothetical protein